MKKKTLLQFKSDIKEKIGWNAPIGFWYKFIYEQYSKKMFDYDTALEKVARMKIYTGV